MLRRMLAVAVVLVLSGTAHADRHTIEHVSARFVEAWNAHDELAMQELWATDATAICPVGGVVRGGAAAARHFTAGRSQVRVTSVPILQKLANRAGVVDLDVEITGMGAAPFVRRVRIAMVWGPDLPGGHHPDGRYFISSVTFAAPRRSPAAAVLAWLLAARR